MDFHRPSVAEISLDAVKNNIAAIQGKVEKKSRVMAVVKADAYGHGMKQVARAALDAGAAWLGIATVDEAIALRDGGFSEPVMILGPTFPSDAEVLVYRDISVGVGSLEVLKALSKAAKKHQKNARIHLKVDTGMGRFGFWWEELIPLLSEIKNMPGLLLEGCYTHFAVSDMVDLSYTKWQHENFRKFLDAAQKNNASFNIVHAANSGGILQHPDTYHNMVRAGVILYGMLPDPETKPTVSTKPVMTLVTRLIEIRTYPKGRYISYGCTFRTQRQSRIGILPIGYGDGISRKLSNKGEVLIWGSRAPIVGRVCMDQILVDLTDIPSAKIGDEVLLWGKKGKNALKVEEVAAWCETITYDVTCALGRRVPRVYI